MALSVGIARADTTWVETGLVAGRWTAASSPYVVRSTITVPPLDTLRVEEGVLVFFQGPWALQVEGVLHVEGTLLNSVIFTADTLANPAGWRGIRFLRPRSASRLVYSIIEYGRSIGENDFGLGGAIFCDAAVVEVYSGTFRWNRASSGQAIFCRDGSHLTLANCDLYENGNMSGCGGGIRARGNSRLEIRDCNFSGNRALYGAGICLDAGTAEITNTTFSKNIAGIWGGAIYATASTITIRNSELLANRSTGGGGIDGRSDVQLTMERCVVAFNSTIQSGAEGPGGGLALQGGQQTIVNSTFIGNSAAAGGALLAGSGTRIENCIFVGSPQGRAIAFPFGGATVRHNCFAGNTGGDFSGFQIPANLGTVNRVNGNADSCDTYFNIYSNPLFDDSADRGYQLGPDSPCIDAGSPAAPRDPDGSLADIGAFWYHVLAGEPEAPVIARTLQLHPAFPNPFNPVTTLRFDVLRDGFVSLRIVDLLGRETALLVSGPLAAGSHALQWQAADRPSGTYFAILEAGGERMLQKLLLIK